MLNKKKASAQAGQKLRPAHYQPAAALLQAGDSGNDPYQKPSRQNRRQKRTWRRRPGKSLTRSTSRAHTFCTVLNTPRLAVSAPVSQSGFFTSIGFSHVDSVSTAIGQWPGSAQPYNSLRAKSASRLSAVLKYLAAPQQGVNSTYRLGAIMAVTLKTRNAGTSERTPRLFPLSFRLAAYRSLRHIAGPALAHRVAFSRCGGGK